MQGMAAAKGELPWLVAERPPTGMVPSVFYCPPAIYATLNWIFSIYDDVERRCRIFQVHRWKNGGCSLSKFAS